MVGDFSRPPSLFAPTDEVYEMSPFIAATTKRHYSNLRKHLVCNLDNDRFYSKLMRVSAVCKENHSYYCPRVFRLNSGNNPFTKDNQCNGECKKGKRLSAAVSPTNVASEMRA